MQFAHVICYFVHNSLSWTHVQMFIVSLVPNQLDNGNATFAGISVFLLRRMQSVMIVVAKLIVAWSNCRGSFGLIYSLFTALALARMSRCRLAVSCEVASRTVYLSQPIDKLKREMPLNFHYPFACLRGWHFNNGWITHYPILIYNGIVN